MGKIQRFTVGEPLHVRTLLLSSSSGFSFNLSLLSFPLLSSRLCLFSFLSLFISVSLLLFSFISSSLLFASVWRVLCCFGLCCAVCGCVAVRGCVVMGREGCMHRTRLRVYVQNAHRVYIQNVPVCTGTTPTCFTHVGVVVP